MEFIKLFGLATLLRVTDPRSGMKTDGWPSAKTHNHVAVGNCNCERLLQRTNFAGYFRYHWMTFQHPWDAPFHGGIFSCQHHPQARGLVVLHQAHINTHHAGERQQFLIMVGQHSIDIARRI